LIKHFKYWFITIIAKDIQMTFDELLNIVYALPEDSPGYNDIRTFKTTDLLEPYLDQIKLPDT